MHGGNHVPERWCLQHGDRYVRGVSDHRRLREPGVRYDEPRVRGLPHQHRLPQQDSRLFKRAHLWRDVHDQRNLPAGHAGLRDDLAFVCRMPDQHGLRRRRRLPGGPDVRLAATLSMGASYDNNQAILIHPGVTIMHSFLTTPSDPLHVIVHGICDKNRRFGGMARKPASLLPHSRRSDRRCSCTLRAPRRLPASCSR